MKELQFMLEYHKRKSFFDQGNWETTDFSGKLENGMKQGTWENYFTNGNLAEFVNYKNDTFNWVRVRYTPTGDTSVCEKYNMGIIVDTYKLFVGGILNLLEFRDSLGLLQGEFRIFANDNLSQIGHFVDNEFHGDFILYDSRTGKVKQIYEYNHGEKSGVWIYFDDNGDTLKIENYK